MALPALLSGLGRQLGKSAIKGTAQKILGGGKDKQQPNNRLNVGENRTTNVGYKKSSALVPTLKPIDFGASPPSQGVSTSTKSDPGSLLTIKEKVIKIENLLGEQYKNRKKREENQRKLSERAKRKEKEKLLEKTPEEKENKSKFNIPIPGKGLFDNLMSRVFNFLFWVTIGKILPTIIEFLPQIIGFVKVIGKVMDAIINVAGFILDGFITFVDFGFKVYDKIRGFAGAIGGEGLVKVLDGFTGAVETLLNLLFIISMANAVGGGFGDGRGRGDRGRPRPGQRGRPRVTTTGGRGVNRPDIRNPLRDRPRVTTTGGGTAGRPDIRNPLRSRPTVTTGAGREIIEGAGKKAAGEAAEQITKKTALLAVGKFIQPFTKRIPVFGAIVDFIINVALGENVGRAAARAIGSGLGAWAGGAIGGFAAAAAGSVVPFLGTALGGFAGAAFGSVLGGMLGDYVGGWLYDTVVGGGEEGSIPKERNAKENVPAKRYGGIVKYEEGGQLGETIEETTEESSPNPLKFRLKKTTLSDIKNVGKDNKSYGKIYTGAGVKKLIDLGNSMKNVPIVGGAMYAAINVALGNKVDQNTTRAIAYDLMSLSNLDAFNDVTSSVGSLEMLMSMKSGGEVQKLIYESDTDTDKSVTNLSLFLDRKINSEELQEPSKKEEEEAEKGAWWDPLGLFKKKEEPTKDDPDAPDGPGAPGGPGGPGGGVGTPEQKALLDAISFAEGTSKSYGTIFGGKVIPELEKGELTVAQVLEMQRTGKLNGRNVGYGTGYDSDATGRYQFMSYTLKEEVQKQGVPMDAKFTPALQDKLILGRLARFRGVTPELLSKEGLSTNVLDKLAPEFASFPYSPKGNASYYGQPVKTPDSIRKAYQSALGKRKEEEKIAKSQQQSPVATTSKGSREAGKGSKLAGELGRFLDSKGLGSWGSGVHQHPEHPPWPKESGHRSGSLHYESQGARAIDIGGWGPNLFKRKRQRGTDDQTKIIAAIREFNSSKNASPVEFYHEGNDPSGHSDHVHVAYEGGGLIKPRKQMTFPDSFASYNNPQSSTNTQVYIKPVAVPVRQSSPDIDRSTGGITQFAQLNSSINRQGTFRA